MSGNAIHRLFFAVWPEAEARRQLEALAEQLGKHYAARWVRPARYHLTLAFVATTHSCPELPIEQALDAAMSVRVSAFAWHPNRVHGFRTSRPPCVLGASRPCAPLQDMHRQLRDALTRADVAVADRRRYVPHITLGYGRGRAIGEMMIPPLDFPVRAFVLLHSVSGESRYRELGRWELAPSD